MNLKILLSISIIILALSASSAEATLDVWINGISFKPSDEVHIGIMIENDNTEAIVYEIMEYFHSNEYKENAFIYELSLEPNEDIFIPRVFNVSENMIAGTYEYDVTVFRNAEIVEQDNASFEVTGTLSRFEYVYYEICYDSNCKEIGATPPLSESPVYIKLYETEQATLAGTLTLPDNSKKDLIFKGNIAKIPIDQLGTYKASITVTKEGYQSETLQTEFYVMEKDAVIGDLFAPEPQLPDYVYHVIVLAVAAIVSVIMIYKKKHKPTEESGWEELGGRCCYHRAR